MSLGFHVWPVFYFFAFGRSGGPRRNACMLEVLLVLQKHGYTVAVEAFDLGGRGTADMIDRARRAQVRVEATHG